MTLSNFILRFCQQDSHFATHPISVSELNDIEYLRNLVEKLNLCVNQLEQFAVRSHDLPSAPGR